ncbi:PAS domain S-box protein [uncultured Desulfobulbus sp.]|uniref:PAS domain S-box protein n=1 Tax=uncultured Desulfobulbus sp. TaxID=239745 RepID=UPI0029C91936|nr:PAS domain S-box protein [uncultured Desulfobulbus sp.]
MTTATLLIVEDDGILAANLEHILTDLGYGVLGPVATGEEAITLLRDHPADMVLMDIELAGELNGIETAEIINHSSDVPIVFVTGFSHDPLLEQAKIVAPYGYLIKPVPERELAATVAMSLHRHSLDRQLRESRVALEESEAQYRHLFENSPMGIFRTTLDGKALLVNAEMARMVGCVSPEEAVREYTDLARQFYVDPKKRYEFIALLQAHGEVRQFKYQGRKKTGETIWVVMNARLTAIGATGSPGEKQVIDGFALDITEQKKAEEAVEESEQRHRHYLENTPYGVFAADTQGHYTQVNPSACRITGYAEHELLTMHIADLHFQEDWPELQSHFQTVLRDGRFQGEVPFRMKNGERRWMSLTALNLADTRVVGFCNDITEQKRTQEALERRIIALVQPLDSLKEIAVEELFNLQDLQRIQDDFAQATGVASIITHADGTPITAPSNFCRLCSGIIRTTEIGRANCFRSDALIGQACKEGPTIQRCLSGGLWDAGAGITVGGRHIANWLIGQVRDETQTEEQMRAYARQIGADEETVIEAFHEVPAMSLDRFEKIAQALFTLASHLSASAYQNMQQARFITERKRAEQALQESKEQLQSLFRVAPTGIGVVRDRVFVEVNTRVCEMTGYTAEELVGQNARLVYPTQEDFDYVGKEKYRQIREVGSGVVETRWQRKDGVILDILLASTPLDAAGLAKGSIFTALDITARKRTEALLRESEARYRELVENANSIILRMDSEGRISFFNEYAQHFFGYAAKEVLGRSVAGTIVPETDSTGKDLRALIADIGQRPELYATNENENIRRDGTRVWVAWSNKPFYNEAGEVTEILCVGNDMTERKLAEEEKRHLQAQLLHAQKLEAIGTLAGGIAHDFNNILAAVIGYADMARENVAEGTTLARDLNQILKAGHRAKDLVKQILTFSRQTENEPTTFFPSVIVKEVIKLLRPSLPTTISIEHQIDTQAGPVHIDPTQLHQILMNLCTNAFHAMEERGGQLSLSLKKVSFDANNLPSVARPGNYIELSVSDTGTGITQDIRHRIFDPFFTTKGPGKGTGMGLSIIHGIVTSYNGFITLDSMPGQGSVFHVYLPQAEQEVLPEEITAEPELSGNEHILFVDDEEVLAAMAQTMLERLGYRVTVRSNGLEALTTFQNHPDLYDLVITDQTMPGMTGMDLARRLLLHRPNLPIILCTGYSTLISKEEAKAHGVREFALKPLTKKDMATLIKKVLHPG